MIKNILLIIMMISFTNIARCELFKEDFEKKDSLKNWEIMQGNPEISSAQKHGGKFSLSLPQETRLFWFADDKKNRFGKASFWVYDSKVGGKSLGKNANGPKFGLINFNEQKFFLGIIKRQDRAVWGTYNWCSTIAGDSDWWQVGPEFHKNKVTKGWHKFTFNVSDKETIEVSIDETAPAKISAEKSEFDRGFSGVCFENKKDGEETFFYDDIEIEFK